MTKVSIGMPVYNAEDSLETAIESLLSQTFGDFELIISDNNSDDQTESICRKFVSIDSRIHYIRQSQNLGSYFNLQFVFRQAKSDYFMWAGSDDTRTTDVIEKNIRFLSGNESFVGSASPNCFDDAVGDKARRVTVSLEGSTYVRIREFMDDTFRSHVYTEYSAETLCLRYSGLNE
jgi:glycosyltransferase involved in cell wall biosynthesis